MASKKRFSGWSVILSVCMVQFVLGLFGTLIINSQRLTEHLQENVLAILYFDTRISEVDLSEKTKSLNELDYVKEAHYITAQQAAYEYKEVLGKDFVEVLGNNPLPASIEVVLSASSLEGNVDDAVEELKSVEGANSLEFQEDLVHQIEKNKHIVGVVLMAIALVLLIVALILINNTIRLDVYSKRFIVKSMQLVGASEWFIVRPFMWKSFVMTVISGALAFGLVYTGNRALTTWVERNFFEIEYIFKADIMIYSVLFATIMILGLVIVLPSTYFATKKYLRLRIDDLY
ncbi:MAG: FtsX-like permease family protein [Bacteroidia bacterium]|nr:FtsX-like permease family protein [Bacteroidia bacterium]